MMSEERPVVTEERREEELVGKGVINYVTRGVRPRRIEHYNGSTNSTPNKADKIDL